MKYARAYTLVLCVLVAIVVLVPKLVGLGVILTVLTLIIGAVKKKVVFQKPTLISYLFIGLYLSYVVGMMFTNHPDIAGKYLEYKLSMVLLPVLFLFVPKERIGLNLLFGSFTISVFLLGSIHLVMSFLHAEKLTIYNLTSSSFSTLHHPTYFSAYAFLAMAIMYYWLRNKNESLIRNRPTIVIILFVFILFQFFAMSLAGLLVLMLFGLIVVLRFVFERFGKMVFLLCLVFAPVSLILLLMFTPGLKEQVEVSKKYVLEYIQNPEEFIRSKQTYVGGNETRLIMWTAASKEIGNHPMGVGTGNVDEVLQHRLVKMGQPAMAEKNLNPHNQYLQTALEVGVLGLLLFVGILVFGGVFAIKNRSVVLFMLTLSLAFNSLFESMVQRQSGIVFYTLWLMLLVTVINREHLQKSTKE